jgi:tetratricopeptide (TPR) repeat protein
MRTLASKVAVIGLCLLGPGPVTAGLYNTSEPPAKLDLDFRLFRNTLFELRRLGLPPQATDAAVHKRYDLIALLGSRGVPANATVEQRLDLSAYLVRRKKYNEAIQVLEPVVRGGQANFLVLANLGTAYQLFGELRRAADYLAQASSQWPAEWDKLKEDQQKWLLSLGWNEAQFQWYRRAETFHRKLVLKRLLEASRQPNKRNPESLDALFEGGEPPRPVRFVGPSGKYEAGTLAADERARMPKDALALVQQLLVWLPDDQRLYWLLGELYNAGGETAWASDILGELLKSNFRTPDLVEHRRALQAQPPKVIVEEGPAKNGVNPPPDKGNVEPAEEGNAARPQWQTLGIGFGAGVLASLFGMWQLREIRRRREKRRAAAARAASAAAAADTSRFQPAAASTDRIQEPAPDRGLTG